eukprot:scaffold75510_cov26-Tisochrysis_lutea.AAC.1
MITHLRCATLRLGLHAVGHLALLQLADALIEDRRVLPHNLEADSRVSGDDAHIVVEVNENVFALRLAGQPLRLALGVLESGAVDDDGSPRALYLAAPLARRPLRQDDGGLHAERGGGGGDGQSLPAHRVRDDARRALSTDRVEDIEGAANLVREGWQQVLPLDVHVGREAMGEPRRVLERRLADHVVDP